MSDLMDTVTYTITLTSATHLVLLQQIKFERATKALFNTVKGQVRVLRATLSALATPLISKYIG
jgi:hypothetical protein